MRDGESAPRLPGAGRAPVRIALLATLLLLLGCGRIVEEAAEVETRAATPTAVGATPTATAVATVTGEATAAANADVLFVEARQTAADTWTFAVTVQHPDTGWDDYTDGWDVVLPDGCVVKPNPDDPFTRLLLHPHVNEQPFTRSQSGVVIPADAAQVTVRAHDLVAGFGGREVVVDLTAASGPDFTVTRQP